MKISKFIYAAVVGGVLASCQSVDTPMFSDKDAFVAFDSKSTSIAENAAREVKIPISLVASKGLDVSVGFEIDTTAYAGKNAAKEGVNYRLKNTSNTLSFTDGGEMVATCRSNLSIMVHMMAMCVSISNFLPPKAVI